jgi:hypothetical protein
MTGHYWFRTYDWDRAVGLVDALMARYELPQAETQKVT